MKPEVAKVIAGAEIIPRLAPSSGPEDGRPIPEEILGARIVRFGTISSDLLPSWLSQVETVGLVIDYVPQNASFMRRLVLGFNDRGMWVEHQSDPGSSRRPRQTLA
jgi:hypothetical protein